MQTFDLKKQLQSLYTPSAKAPEIVDVPPLSCLMIDGEGDPNVAQVFKDSVSALYSAAFTLRFAFKRRGIDYPVMRLEGLWWIEKMADFLSAPKESWLWTMLIVQPDVVTEADFAQALADVKRKKPLPALDRLRLETFSEGLAAQIMHIGPYGAEAPTIERLHRFIAEQGYELTGKHHEIYVSDPSRTAPEKLKTIIRQPISREHETVDNQP